MARTHDCLLRYYRTNDEAIEMVNLYRHWLAEQGIPHEFLQGGNLTNSPLFLKRS